MYFGENQLSPGLISLSLLPTPHRPHFQLWCVRSSRRYYPPFNLDMGRSLGFRVYAVRLDALLRLAFAAAPPIRLNLATQRNSQAHDAKGTWSHVRLRA